MDGGGERRAEKDVNEYDDGGEKDDGEEAKEERKEEEEKIRIRKRVGKGEKRRITSIC